MIGSRNDALLQHRRKAMAIEMATDQVVAASIEPRLSHAEQCITKPITISTILYQ